MAASSMKDIKNRIKSVEGTMHITKAMELVASSKLRRAKERAQMILPFMKLLDDTISGVISNCGAGVMSAFTEKRTTESEKVCIVLVAGDRGLAGGFNNNVFKLAKELSDGKDTVYLPVGKKAYEYCVNRGYDISDAKLCRTDETGEAECTKICEKLTEEYKKGSFDSLYVVYNEFVSMLSQEPRAVKLLPFDKRASEEKGSKALTLYEPSPEDVISAIVPQYIGGMLYGAICESLASEYGARRMAMESASKNAQEIIDDLSLKYNRARQASITQEITEIVSGANAL